MNSNSFSWTAIGSISVVLVSGIITQSPPLTSLRPSTKDLPIATPVSPGKVPARLWQDPLQIGWSQIQSVRQAYQTHAFKHLGDQWSEAPDLLKVANSESVDGIEKPFIVAIKSHAHAVVGEKLKSNEGRDLLPEDWKLVANTKRIPEAELTLMVLQYARHENSSDKLRKLYELPKLNPPKLNEDQAQCVRDELVKQCQLDYIRSQAGVFLNLKDANSEEANKKIDKLLETFCNETSSTAYTVSPNESSPGNGKMESTTSTVADQDQIALKNLKEAVKDWAENAAKRPDKDRLAGLLVRLNGSISPVKLTDSEAEVAFTEYENGIKNKARESRFKIDLVLPVVLSGRSDADLREARLRSRYAFQEAMEALKYRPLSSSDLGYFPVPIAIDVTSRETLGMVKMAGFHIGLSTPSGDVTKEKNSAIAGTEFIPVTFEIFELQAEDKGKSGGDDDADPLKRVCVLWIDDRIVTLGDSPHYLNVNVIAQHVLPNVKVEDIITLSSSDEMRALLDDDIAIIPNGVQLHYCKSTWLPENGFFGKEAAKVRPGTGNTEDAPAQNPAPSSKRDKIQRIMPVDPYSLQVLIGELALRSTNLARGLQPKPVPDASSPVKKQGDKPEKSKGSQNNSEERPPPKPEVWLFSEQDTLYSDSMVREFKKLVNERWTVESFQYLRGVDGGLPPDSQSGPPKSSSEPGEKLLEAFSRSLLSSGENTSKGFDQRQLDYLERQADTLFQDQRGKPYHERVKAIGVLGSDVYDKLVVLQVLKKRFPAVHYFTTELDALYLDPSLRSVTQNLLIGSAFELAPTPPYSADPCFRQVRFRDSYQTALYQCVTQILGRPTPELSPRVRVFEVGRHGFELPEYPPRANKKSDNEGATGAAEASDPWVTFKELPSGFSKKSWDREPFDRPDTKTILEDFRRLPTDIIRASIDGVTPDRLVSKKDVQSIVFPSLFVLGALLFAALLCVCQWGTDQWDLFRLFKGHSAPRSHDPEPAAGPKKQTRKSFLFLMAVGWQRLRMGMHFVWNYSVVRALLFLGIFAVIATYLVSDTASEFGEPYNLISGTSVYPSILIRASAVILALCLLRVSILELFGNVRHGGLDGAGFEPLVAEFEPLKSYREDVKKAARSALGFTMLGIILINIVYSTCERFGDPFLTPARGFWAFFWHEITMSLSTGALLFSTAWAYVIHRNTRRLVTAIRDRDSGEAQVSPPISEGGARYLLGVCEPAGNTVLTPFVLMVLLLASRHSVFDGWNIPATFLFTHALLLAIVLWASIDLSSAAWRLKKSETQKLKRLGKVPATQARLQVEEVWDAQSGPFAQLRNQPLMQALLLVLAGIGLNAAEPFMKLFGL